jgi:hypothetical protein
MGPFFGIPRRRPAACRGLLPTPAAMLAVAACFGQPRRAMAEAASHRVGRPLTPTLIAENMRRSEAPEIGVESQHTDPGKLLHLCRL